ncbi:MAG: hypothetical protein HPM95_08805 [Alphaproteobacteria bacterium]|nr:hypothetical protein [Alphaproteobacteria bacterium]
MGARLRISSSAWAADRAYLGLAGISTGVDRMRGFLDGLVDHGLEPVACVDGRYDRATAMAATREIFAGPERPEAVFVGNDHMAFAAVLEALPA